MVVRACRIFPTNYTPDRRELLEGLEGVIVYLNYMDFMWT